MGIVGKRLLTCTVPSTADNAGLCSVWHSACVSAPPAAAPSGVVTFLFTDVEASTRRWEADADGMRAALAAHDEVLRWAIEAHGGWLFKHTGDGTQPAANVDTHSARRQFAIRMTE
jgi:class 3 adenylate cyclase